MSLKGLLKDNTLPPSLFHSSSYVTGGNTFFLLTKMIKQTISSGLFMKLTNGKTLFPSLSFPFFLFPFIFLHALMLMFLAFYLLLSMILKQSFHISGEAYHVVSHLIHVDMVIYTKEVCPKNHPYKSDVNLYLVT